MRMGPSKDYPGLYGDARCKTCQHLQYDERCHKMRCEADGNKTVNWLGTIWKQSPEAKNHLGKCEDYSGL